MVCIHQPYGRKDVSQNLGMVLLLLLGFQKPLMDGLIATAYGSNSRPLVLRSFWLKKGRVRSIQCKQLDMVIGHGDICWNLHEKEIAYHRKAISSDLYRCPEHREAGSPSYSDNSNGTKGKKKWVSWFKERGEAKRVGKNTTNHSVYKQLDLTPSHAQDPNCPPGTSQKAS